jgi:hypothetical protein
VNENEHISKEEFLSFQNNSMNPSDMEKFLTHISSCDYCADQLTAYMAEDIIIAPRDMKDNILRGTKRPEIQLAIKVRETSKRVQLFIYSLKVCTVTACALLIMMFTMNSSTVTGILNASGSITTEATDNVHRQSLTTIIKNSVDTINNGIIDFSNNFINKEVTDNDQKEE